MYWVNVETSNGKEFLEPKKIFNENGEIQKKILQQKEKNRRVFSSFVKQANTYLDLF